MSAPSTPARDALLRTHAAANRVVAGIFVGGRSTRMGGRPKGLLTAPEGDTLVERWCRVLRAAGIEDVVLVGAHPAYASLGLESVDDRPAGIGPLGGILALLHHAELTRAAFAVAVACDMPFVSSALLQRLVATSEALVVAPRRAGRWEPLCARYHAGVASLGERRVAMGDYSLQRWLDEAAAVELPLEADEADQLCDWDTPEDMAPGHCAERAR